MSPASKTSSHPDAAPETEGTSKGHAHFERLRRKLRWQILGAYVVPLVLLAAYFHLEYQGSLRRETDAHLRSIAESQRNTVDLFLQERVQNLRTAFRPGAFDMPPTDEAARRVLAELREESTTFVDVGVFDPAGVLVAYAGPYGRLRGREYGGEEWFRSLHSGTADHTISDVYMGFRGRPHFVIAVLRTIDGRPWTLRASLDPERFTEYVGRSHLADEAEAFIVNREGARQTVTPPGADGRAAPGYARERVDETRVVEVREDGQAYLAAVAWLRSLDWAVVVRLPASAVSASARDSGVVVSVVALAALVVVVLLAFRATRRLVSRLEEQKDAKDALERQLFNAAKLASVGEMAAGVAHEINNPLAVIHEEAGIMLDVLDPSFGLEPDLAEFRTRLESISSAALRGRSITSKLLAFARKHEPKPEPTDVTVVIEDALAIKANDFNVSDITVERGFQPALPLVAINRNELEQVLLNLLNNARDAIGREGGAIKVRTRSDGEWVEIDVEDTGCGMAPHQLEKIFFPFYTTKEVGKGTGLGLAISYGIVKAMGGRIGVESEVGRGTTFTITLPAMPPAGGEAATGAGSGEESDERDSARQAV